MSLILYKFETQVLWTTCLCPPTIPALKLSHSVNMVGDGAFRRGLGLDEVMSMEPL